jgi:hypothetical protein
MLRVVSRLSRRAFIAAAPVASAAAAQRSGFNTSSDRLDVELTFVNLLHELNADENASRVQELLEAEHRPDAELHSPVILLDDVVQVRTTANLLLGSPNGS